MQLESDPLALGVEVTLFRDFGAATDGRLGHFDLGVHRGADAAPAPGAGCSRFPAVVNQHEVGVAFSANAIEPAYHLSHVLPGVLVRTRTEAGQCVAHDQTHLPSALLFNIADVPDDGIRISIAAKEIDTSHLGLIKFRLKTPLGESAATLPMSGRHNLMNALAAAAVATCFEIQPARIAEALSSATPPRMRGEVLDFAAGFRVVDDSYNSNPRSLINMVRTIVEAGTKSKRRRVIAGEMLELGPEEAALHREAGHEIARAGIDSLWGVRGLAAEIVAGAREAGLVETSFFESADEAARAIVDEVREGDLVLVKGSRGVATDKIVSALRKRFPLAAVRQT